MAATTMQRRWRRRTRGAAMTEFLVGLPVMVLLWVGVNYFRQGFVRRMETMNQSHSTAWQKAYSNDGSCYAGGGPFPGWTEPLSNMPADNGGEGLDKKFSSSMFMYGVARGPKSMATTSSRFSGHVSSNTTITCNEVVPAKDADRNVLTPLADFVRSFL
jgi:hypothetical protein